MRALFLFSVLAAATPAAGTITVAGLDPRLELGEIAYWLKAEPEPGDLVTPVAKAYYEDAVAHFGPWSGHPAAALSARIAPPEDPTPEESAVYRIKTSLGAPPKNLPSGAAKKWLDALDAFSKDARFDEFYAKRALRFDPALKVFRDRFKQEEYLKPFEAYVGREFGGEARIVFSPSLEILSAGRGDAVQLRGKDGRPRIEAVFTTLLLDDLGDSGLPEDVAVTLWHELGHAMVDPLCDAHWDEIKAKRTQNILPEEWEAYVKDMFAQAVVVRLFVAREGKKAGWRQLSYEEPPERAYLEALTGALKVYESDRKTHPSLDGFFGELVKALP